METKPGIPFPSPGVAAGRLPGLAKGDSDTFPARLTESHDITDGGIPRTGWSWEEVTYAAGGEFVAVEGGRSGDGDTNTAFEVNGRLSGVGDIVFMRPGWFDASYGRGPEWLFDCWCQRYSIPPGGYIETSCCERTPRIMCAAFSDRKGDLAGLPNKAIFELLPENEWLGDPTWYWEGARSIDDPNNSFNIEVEYAIYLVCAESGVIIDNDPPYHGWYYAAFPPDGFSHVGKLTTSDCVPFSVRGSISTHGQDEFGFGEAKGTATVVFLERVNECPSTWPEEFYVTCCDPLPLLPMRLKAVVSGGTGLLATHNGEYTLVTVGYVAPDCANSWFFWNGLSGDNMVIFGIGCDFNNFNCDKWLISGTMGIGFQMCPFIFPHTATLDVCSCDPFFLLFHIDDDAGNTATVTVTLP